MQQQAPGLHGLAARRAWQCPASWHATAHTRKPGQFGLAVSAAAVAVSSWLGSVRLAWQCPQPGLRVCAVAFVTLRHLRVRVGGKTLLGQLAPSFPPVYVGKVYVDDRLDLNVGKRSTCGQATRLVRPAARSPGGGCRAWPAGTTNQTFNQALVRTEYAPDEEDEEESGIIGDGQGVDRSRFFSRGARIHTRPNHSLG